MRRLLLLAGLAVPSLAGGQGTCVAVEGSGTRWEAPLNRVVRIRAAMPVREAIDEAGRQLGVAFAYSVDLLPRGREACTAAGGAPLGDALAQWLGPSTLAPFVAASDRVVLVPGRREVTRPVVPPESLSTPAYLAPVRVEEARTLPLVAEASLSHTVIDRGAIAASGASTISQLLTTHVPGMWIWTPSPSSLGTAVASLRGASSFGSTYPKVFIDGIEVANPLFLAQLAPDQVARIVVIRGPQGAALYGSGAVSGVIQITTREAGGLAEPTHLAVRSTAGLAESAYSPLGSLVQEHAVSGRVGSEHRSLSVGGLVATTGAFVPGAYGRQLQGTIGASVLGRRARWQLTARGASQDASNPMSPLLPQGPAATANHSGDSPARTMAVAAPMTWDSTRTQSVRELTLGSSVAFERHDWSHEAVAGFDGYQLDNLAITPGRFRTPGDSALLAAAGSANRLGVRWTANRHFAAPAVVGAITFVLEQSSLRDATRGASFAPATGTSAIWRHTTGGTAQAEVTLRNQLVLNGGLRMERNSGYTLLSGLAALPSLGAAFRQELGHATVTVRGAYGKAIQQPRVGSRENPWGGRSPAVAALEPEAQSGFELGVDVRYGAAAMLSLTRYDQQASNLIQPVVTRLPGGRGLGTRLENIGAIDNSGWEVEGRLSRGALNLTGSLGIVDSRVARLATAYRGDLQPNDRVLQVPAHTASLAANWLGRGWSLTGTVARAGNWMNYDWVALAAETRPLHDAELRNYWIRYPGITRLGMSASREIAPGFELQASGENLLGTQRGEPDNVTIVPGRTFRAGLRARF